MRNPTFAGDFQHDPMPERCTALRFAPSSDYVPGSNGPSCILSMGIKTVTHNRSGLKLHPLLAIVVEIREGEEIASFDMPPSAARHYAKRLVEFADKIEEAD